MKCITPKLKAFVIDEAKKLKKYATKEEINNLSFVKLDGDSNRRCVYGQMTGDCRSDRAFKLIGQCCNRVYSKEPGYTGIANYKLNGSPANVDRYLRVSYYLSPIEAFIYLDQKKDGDGRKKLISFLKDETKTLKL